MRVIAVAVLTASLIGCGTTPHKAYSGAERSPNELAVIKWMYGAGKGYYGIVVEKVDDFAVPQLSNTTRVAVTPGNHQLKVKCRDRKYKTVALGSLDVNVEKGKIYVLFGKLKNGGSGPTCNAMVRVYNSEKDVPAIVL